MNSDSDQGAGLRRMLESIDAMHWKRGEVWRRHRRISLALNHVWRACGSPRRPYPEQTADEWADWQLYVGVRQLIADQLAGWLTAEACWDQVRVLLRARAGEGKRPAP